MKIHTHEERNTPRLMSVYQEKNTHVEQTLRISL